ncbi:MAG TPA: copper resistance CopC family protein [Candidatus Saccharimonadales bacterium]|nr:copper resistance CopC family protein [Candidatus Saccharimonadales bacterium]
MQPHLRWTRRWALPAAVAALLLLPSGVLAHAELDVPTPADGATVEGTPTEIFGTFTQAIEPDGSSLILRDAAGDEVARGGLDPTDDQRMVIDPVPVLAPGEYEVRWTTISAEDGELDRETWSFTVVAAASPSPTVAASASATAEPSASPIASASASPIASAGLSPAPSPIDGSAAGSTTDAILPIVVGLALVLLGAGYLLSRRGRPTGGA